MTGGVVLIAARYLFVLCTWPILIHYMFQWNLIKEVWSKHGIKQVISIENKLTVERHLVVIDEMAIYYDWYFTATFVRMVDDLQT